MGAIGNYIHLTSKGYKVAGTIRQGHGTPTGSAEKSLLAQRQSILNKINTNANNQKTKKLENSINNLIIKLGKDDKQYKDWSSKVNEKIEKDITEEFKNLASINFEKGYAKTRGVGQIKTNYTSYKNWREQLVLRVNTLNNYLREMETLAINKNGVNSNEYSKAIQKLETLLNDTYEKTWQKISETGMPVNNKVTKNMIRALNDLIREYAAIRIIRFEGTGSYFDNVAKIIPEKAKNIAETAINTTLKEVAANNSNMTLSLDESKFMDSTQVISFGDIEQQIEINENSLNITFSWRNETFNTNIKTLDLKNMAINVTSQSYSLLTLLQNENIDFINHYFNIFAKHRGPSISEITSRRQEYLNVMKLTVIYNCLNQGLSGNNNQNIFIISDKVTGRVKILSIDTFIQDYINGKNEYIKLNPEANLSKLYTNTKIEGNENRDGLKRIQILLQEAHARKISASLKVF